MSPAEGTQVDEPDGAWSPGVAVASARPEPAGHPARGAPGAKKLWE